MTNAAPLITRPVAPSATLARPRRRARLLFTPVEPMRLFHAFRA